MVVNFLCYNSGVDKLKATITVLEKLDPEIVPAILSCQKSDSNDMAAAEHLQFVRSRWSTEVSFLLSVIDEISDCVIISEVSGTCTLICMIYPKNVGLHD